MRSRTLLLLFSAVLIAGLLVPSTILASPRARYAIQPTSPAAGKLVKLDASRTSCDRGPCSYRWARVIKRGTRRILQPIGRGKVLAYTFWQPGTKVVRLTVRNRKGRESSTTKRIVVATATPTSSGGTQTSPTPGGTLVPIDGGPSYFAQFAKHGPMDDPSYFPLWLWGQYNMTNANIAKDKSEGFNGYYALANPEPDANLDGIAAAGMSVVLDAKMVYDKPAVVGWVLGDEADMCTNCPSAGLQAMRTADASAPKDGRFRFMNYSKGVAFWWDPPDAGAFVNGDGTNLTQGTPGGFQDVVSADNYWFNDPDLQDARQGQCFYQGCGVGGNLTADQAQRAYNYALTIKRERDLDALDGKRQPVFAQIEMGWPTTQGTRLITPAEMRAAFWQSIIGGARGVVYFPFAWAGPCGTTNYIQRETSSCWAAINQMATSVNAQAKQLAPVLNAPFVDGFVSTSAGIDAMAKAGPDGHYYVFAGNKDNSARTATFALNGIASATATVMGENRSVAITNGSFSDSFADGNAIHIYRIDGVPSAPSAPSAVAAPSPRAALVGRLPTRVSLRSGRLAVPVTCYASCTVRSRLTRPRGSSRATLLASARRTLGAGRHKLVLRLSRRARQRVAHARRPLSLRLDTVIRQVDGSKSQRTQRLVVGR